MVTPSKSLDLTTIPRRSPNAAWRDVDGETILLDTAGHMMRGLNAAGGAAWRLVDGVRSIGEIARVVAQSAPASAAPRVGADVLAFFAELHAHGLVTRGGDDANG